MFKVEMNPIDKKELDIVFTIAMPIDRTAIVNMVVSLQGIVDKKNIIKSDCRFVKDDRRSSGKP